MRSNWTRNPNEVTRTADDIQVEQARARMDDANASTRTNTITLSEIKKARS